MRFFRGLGAAVLVVILLLVAMVMSGYELFFHRGPAPERLPSRGSEPQSS